MIKSYYFVEFKYYLFCCGNNLKIVWVLIFMIYYGFIVVCIKGGMNDLVYEREFI